MRHCLFALPNAPQSASPPVLLPPPDGLAVVLVHAVVAIVLALMQIDKVTLDLVLIGPLLLVVVFYTTKVHNALVVLIVGPVQCEGHEIVLCVGLQIFLHLVPALLSLGNGRAHVFLVGAEGQHAYDLLLVGVAMLLHHMAPAE